MTEVKTIKCEIHCQNGESIHAAFPAVPGIWEREEIYVEVSENRSYGCRYGQIRLNMRQGALRKEKPIRVSLPTVQSPEKITAMYMLNDWWTRPAFVEGFQEIPARTQVAFLKYPDRFACLVPMVDVYKRQVPILTPAGVGGFDGIGFDISVLDKSVFV